MTAIKYCRNKGMTIDEYDTFTANIKATASAIITHLSTMYPTNTGMYFDSVGAVTHPNADQDTQHFIIQELKSQGLEFINDNTLWRF